MTSTMRKGSAALSVLAAVALTTSVAQSATAAPAPLAPLEATATASSIDGSYIVMLKEGTSASATSGAADRARGNGARVAHEYTGLKGFSAKLNAKQLEKVRQDPAVAYVEKDQVVKATATQTNATWGLDRIDQRDLPLNGTYTYTPTGAGVDAWIIDTGILTSHSQFTGRTAAGYSAINDGRGTSDCNGHGTHVAGTVGGSTYGVAKGVTLIPVRVLGCDGSGTNSGVIAGMDHVTRNRTGPTVVNMSLGGVASQAMDDAIARMTNAGVSVSVAAGNENQNACNVSPARAPSAITVGSTTKTDARSSFSNFGSCVDVFAPGSDITSAWYTSTSATNTISGTSMASPHTAGVAALYLQGNPTASAATVANAITGTASTGKVTGAGTGSPNRLLYSLLSGGGTTPPPTGECATTTTGKLSPGASRSAASFSTNASGTHTGCLTGPSNADFNLYLQKWDGSRYVSVASSLGSTSTEKITYNGTAGSYRWLVHAYSSAGSYTLKYSSP